MNKFWDTLNWLKDDRNQTWGFGAAIGKSTKDSWDNSKTLGMALVDSLCYGADFDVDNPFVGKIPVQSVSASEIWFYVANGWQNTAKDPTQFKVGSNWFSNIPH